MLNGCRAALISAAAGLMLCPASGVRAQTVELEAARDPETSDRMPAWELEALTAKPASILRQGRIEEADAAFEALLARQPPGTAAAADHLTSWGLVLFTFGDDAAKRRSIPYFRRAVDAARRAYGPSHPELALVLATYADAQIVIQPDDPPRSADEALAEAYRIRLQAFGPRNIETLAALIALAEISGLPSRTEGDPVRIAAAAALYRTAAQTSDNRRGPAYIYDYNDFSIHLRRAEMFARNGDPAAALAAAGEAADAVERSRRTDPGDPCFTFNWRVQSLADRLGQGGHAEAIDALAARVEPALKACGLVEPLPG